MMKILINMTAALIFCSTPAYTQQLWCWSFGGPGVCFRCRHFSDRERC